MRTRMVTALLGAVVVLGMTVDLADGAAGPRPAVLADATAGGCASGKCSAICPHASVGAPRRMDPPAPRVPGRRLAWHCRPRQRPAARTTPVSSTAASRGAHRRPDRTVHAPSAPPHPRISGSPHPKSPAPPHLKSPAPPRPKMSTPPHPRHRTRVA